MISVNPMLGGFSPNEIRRFPFAGGVLRCILNPDGSKMLELFTVHSKKWLLIDSPSLPIFAALLGPNLAQWMADIKFQEK